MRYHRHIDASIILPLYSNHESQLLHKKKTSYGSAFYSIILEFIILYHFLNVFPKFKYDTRVFFYYNTSGDQQE